MQNRTIRRDWELTFSMFIVMFLLALVYFFFITVLWVFGVPWVFLAVLAAVMIGLQYYLSDKLVLWSMGAKVVSPQEAPELHAMVDRLCAKAGLPKPKVAIANMDIPNAFATGRNPKNALVCVTTGITRRLDKDELEAVLGHELTHVKNRDVTVITLASFFATLAAMLMNSLMWMGLLGGFGGGGSRRNNSGAGSLMALYLVTIVVWITSNLLILALSRYREYAADRGGSIITGMPSKLASALGKISGVIARIPSEDLRKVEGANAFFIVPALKGDSLLELLSSHPPVAKRIERLHRLAKEIEG